MKKLILLPLIILCMMISCKKDKDKVVISGNIKETTETVNGITYKLFTTKDANNYKGILVIGSGNDENNPSAGSIDGAAETALCKKAAENGYAAAIVKYQKPPNGADWSSRAKLMGEDYDRAIVAISGKYGIDKNKSVVGGFSYASYMLFTHIAYYNSLSYSKGLLAACGSTDMDKISKFKIPVLSLTGRDEYEAYTDAANPQNNAYAGVGLYNKIPANSPIKARSEGFSDPNSTGHCGGNWTDKMYNKMVYWLN
jgi:hypothetical protein